ncbi:hypothetical protein NZK33_20710 [Cyanobium sp. FGCU-6]|nr:hypothetical protein [Cyanobium sp. FGCU6]
MDEITLIMTALVQGAAKAAADVVPDAYEALRDLLRKRFADKPAAEIVLEKHASDPQTYEAPLRKQLEQTALAVDFEVLTIARQLLEQLETPVAAPGIEIGRGAKGIIGREVNNATFVGEIH